MQQPLGSNQNATEPLAALQTPVETKMAAVKGTQQDSCLEPVVEWRPGRMWTKRDLRKRNFLNGILSNCGYLTGLRSSARGTLVSTRRHRAKVWKCLLGVYDSSCCLFLAHYFRTYLRCLDTHTRVWTHMLCGYQNVFLSWIGSHH